MGIQRQWAGFPYPHSFGSTSFEQRHGLLGMDLELAATLVHCEEIGCQLACYGESRAVAMSTFQVAGCRAASCGFQRGASFAASINAVCSH